MALGKEIGEFSFKQTSVTYAQDGGSVSINFDGTATGFGTVLATMIVRGEPGAKQGTCSWRGQAFLDNGSNVVGFGEGTWKEAGKHQWRIQLIVETSDGQIFASDGRVELATRSYSGKIIEWS